MPRIQGNQFFNGSYIFIDYSFSQNIQNNTSTVTWVLGFHYGNAHFRIDNAVCAFGGGPISGDPNGGPYYSGWPAPGGTFTDIGMDSGVFTITHDSNGNRTVSVTASMSSDFGSSGINTNFALPQIPQDPAAPDSASATRVSDSRIDVTWNNNSTTAAPYANVKVYRRINGGSWQLRATLGVVESYQDNSVSANNRYEYRMSAVGVNGAEVGYATTGSVYTTPAAPDSCAAVRLSGGDVRVTWGNNVNYTQYTTRIEHSTNEGSTWAEINSVASGVEEYIHSAPTRSDSHKYRVRARTSSGPTLNSGYSTQSGIIFADPAAPSNCNATRVSDTQASVTWTNNDTSEGPYTNIKVYRRVDGGGWALRATIGVVEAYTDNTISANHKYEYRVSAVGGVNTNESSFAVSNAIFTTPAAPASCVAAKLPNGNIQVTWTNSVAYSEHNIEIQESTNGGANWVDLNTALPSGAISYEHVAPNQGVTHMYRVRSKTSSGTTLFSAYSAPSNTIVLLSTADPPTNLAPSGEARDANEDIIFTWTHNPTDGTPQSAYRIQYEVDGGATQTIGPISSTVSSHTLPAVTLTNNHTITWRVATAGENGTLSANSATASFTTRDRPTSTIDTPGDIYNNSKVTAQWTYFQAQGSPQVAYLAQLYRQDGTFTLLEQKAGTTSNQVTFDTTVLDGLTYAVVVEVTSSDGLKSIQAGMEFQVFTVEYLPPADVQLFTSYNEDNGSINVTIVADAAEPGITEEISSIDLERQIDGGEWIMWVKGLVLQSGHNTMVVVDMIPTINGTNNYRAIVNSALPSSRISQEVAQVTSEEVWGFLSGDADFSRIVKMRANLDTRATIGRDKELHYFAGRERPVELAGEETDLRIAVQAILRGPSSTPRELEELAETPGIVLWRDYTGRRVFASLSDVNVDYETRRPRNTVRFSLRRVDYDENVG